MPNRGENLTRARSKRRVDNDARIRRAATNTIAELGVDRVSMAEIARRSGLTTGALYGRFESLDDLILDCWTHQLSTRMFEVLDGARHQFLGSSDRSRWSDLGIGGAVTTAGLHVLLASRRNPVLGEGLERDLRDWSRKWELDSEGEPTTRMRSAVATAFVLARLITPYLNIDEDDWDGMAEVFGEALLTSTSHSQSQLGTGLRVEAIGVDQLQCDLVNSTMDVIARSGCERSTLTRISRRAGCTTGAIYSRYESKTDLVVDAIEILVASAARVSSQLVIQGANSNAMSTSVARMFHTAVAREREVWNNFRLEVYLAASWDPSIRRCLRRVKQTSDDRYFALLQPTRMFSDDLISQIAIAGQQIPLGLSALAVFADGHRELDYLMLSQRLMELCGAS